MKILDFLLPREAHLVDGETIDSLLSLLSTDVQARVKRFHFVEDRLRSLIGHIAPIYFLRERGLVEPDTQVTFGKSEKGKPYIYNISHDGSHVLFAASEAGPVGMDLMAVPSHTPHTDLFDLIEGIEEQLTISEKQTIQLEHSLEEKSKIVATLWTAKEAYVKALGEGVGFGLERIQVDFAGGGSRSDIEGIKIDGRDIADLGWRYTSGWLDEGRYRWVAIARTNAHAEVEDIEPERIAWEELVTYLIGTKEHHTNYPLAKSAGGRST